MADAPGGPVRPPPFDWRILVVSFRPHLLLFAAAAAVMIAIDKHNPDDVWALWPVAIWAAVIGFHYMALKILTVDDGWANDRVGEVFYKAYDAVHIHDIKGQQRRASGAPAKPASSDGADPPPDTPPRS